MAKGYTKLGNKILEFLYSSDMNVSELKVLLFIIRYTSGFNRDTTRAAISYIARGTNLCENSVRKALKSLIDKGLVEIEYKHQGSAPQILKLILQKVEGSSYQSLRGDTTKVCSTNTTKVCTQDIKEDIKDIYIKEKKENPLSYGNDIEELRRLSEESGDDW